MEKLLERYKKEKNARGVELVSKILSGRITRFLVNEKDDEILKDIQSLKTYQVYKNRSYVNKRGDWVIFPIYE